MRKNDAFDMEYQDILQKPVRIYLLKGQYRLQLLLKKMKP